MMLCITELKISLEEPGSSETDNLTFRNCLVSMRPNAVNNDIPTIHNVMTFIHNEFVSFMEQLKVKIKVSLSQLSIDYGIYSLLE